MSGRSTLGLISALLILGGCSGRLPATGGGVSAEPTSEYRPYRYRVPTSLDDGWVTGSLHSVGMDSRPIERMTDTIRRYSDWNIHAVLIERDGRLAYEEYFAGADQRWGRPLGLVNFDRQTLHDLRSVSKSVLAGRYNDRRAARLADRLLVEHIIPATMPENVESTPEPSSCGRPTAESSRPEIDVRAGSMTRRSRRTRTCGSRPDSTEQAPELAKEDKS